MNTPPRDMIEEMMDDANAIVTKAGCQILKNRDRDSWLRHALTAAYTKGVEDERERVVREMTSKKMHVLINGEGREKEARGEGYELGYDDCDFHLQEILTPQPHDT